MLWTPEGTYDEIRTLGTQLRGEFVVLHNERAFPSFHEFLMWPVRQAYARMMKKVVEDSLGCLIFTGTANHSGENGHGKIRLWKNGKLRWEYVHRIALMVELNVPELGRGVVARHKCDIRRCVNGKHLEPGTQLENDHDRMRRGRTKNQFGACGFDRRANQECPF